MLEDLLALLLVMIPIAVVGCIIVFVLDDDAFWHWLKRRRWFRPSKKQFESDAAKAHNLRRKLVDAQAEVDHFIAEQRSKIHGH